MLSQIGAGVGVTTTALDPHRVRNLQSLNLIALTNTPNWFSDICSTLRTVSMSKSRLENLCLVLHVMKGLEKLDDVDWKAFWDEFLLPLDNRACSPWICTII